MNPDVVSAIARLKAGNLLSGGQAALFDRVARRQLVSVRLEIQEKDFTEGEGKFGGGGAGEKF